MAAFVRAIESAHLFRKSFEESKSEKTRVPGTVLYCTSLNLIFDRKKIKIAPESHARMGSRGGRVGGACSWLLAASCASSAAPFGYAGPVTPQLGNAWCSDEHFLRTFLAPGARNADGLPLRRLREFDTAEPGWQRLLGKSVGDSSETPSQSFGVCPCHNAGFTADSEQWDGQPSSGMEEVSGECYFSIPRCAQYLERGNCPGASPKIPADSSSPARILVATTTPYTVGQLSTRQAGRCSASCEFSSPSFGEAVNLEHFDGIVWPLDWSFGRSNTLPVPTDPEFTRAYRHRQLWIAFSEEEVFKTEGGRPDLWRNRSFLSMFNLQPLMITSADLPFNLWPISSSCTANVYFRPPQTFTQSLQTTSDMKNRSFRMLAGIAAISETSGFYSLWPFPGGILGRCSTTLHGLPEGIISLLARKGACAPALSLTLAIEGSDEPGKSGLVSEKLFDAFAAGTVPIYWGAPRHVVEQVVSGQFHSC